MQKSDLAFDVCCIFSGKTTVGSVLAKSLKYAFMDSDALIEKAAKRPIEEIFEAYGEDEFRELETTV